MTARARDAAGNTTTSSTITVTVPDTSGPTVSITAPANGATISGTVAITARVQSYSRNRASYTSFNRN